MLGYVQMIKQLHYNLSKKYLLKSPPAKGTESLPGRTTTSNIPQTGLWSLVVTPKN